MISINKAILDDLLIQAKENERQRINIDLRNSSDDKSQRMLNALIPGTELSIHRHMTTSETVILIQGNIDEIFYDDEKNEIERFHLNLASGNYGIQIPAGMWHTIEVFEPSVIIEMKDGQYIPITPKDIL